MSKIDQEILHDYHATKIDAVLWNDAHALPLGKVALSLALIVFSALVLGSEPLFDWMRELPLWTEPVRGVLLLAAKTWHGWMEGLGATEVYRFVHKALQSFRTGY